MLKGLQIKKKLMLLASISVIFLEVISDQMNVLCKDIVT